jgi:hypothetical protein
VRFGPLQGSLRSRLAPVLSTGAPLFGFLSPTAPSVPPATPSSFHPRGSPTSAVWLPLPRASFRQVLSRLISSGKRSWGSPFRGFLLERRPESSSLSGSPRVVSRGGHRGPAGCLGLPVAQAWVDFRVLPSVRIRAPVQCSLKQRAGPFPSWASSSVGGCLPSVIGVSPTSLALCPFRLP